MKTAAAAMAAALLPAALAGCGSDDGDKASDPAESPTSQSSRTSPTSQSSPTSPAHSDDQFSLDTAAAGPDVTNPWFPLEPGNRWVYREVDEEGEVLRVVVTATAETRMIANGVEARVVRDTVSRDGEVLEDTLDWYAQDADGTVWYLGEDTAEFEDGELDTTEGSWEAGVDGAEPGVIMPAEPAVGMSYRQEYLEGVAEDHGEVIALDGTANVPAGSYDHLVQTADTNALEPDVLEHKFYARDVGLVLTTEDGSSEELLSVSTVSDREARLAGTAPLGSSY